MATVHLARTWADQPAQHRAAPLALQDLGFAVAILLAPVALVVGGALEPAAHLSSGAENIALNVAANPFTNNLHLASFVVASFLLPISVIGMARRPMQGSPWLATIGGALGLLGWLPFAALTAQDDLTVQMAQLSPTDPILSSLWERFNVDPTMTVFLLVYIVGHLLAYVVLPIALYRVRAIPAWSAWVLASTTPLTMAFFPTRQPIFFIGLCAAFIIGSLPVAAAALRGDTH